MASPAFWAIAVPRDNLSIGNPLLHRERFSCTLFLSRAILLNKLSPPCSRFLQGPATDRSVVKAMRDAINSGTEFRGMVTNYSRTGTLLYNNLVMTPVKNKDGTVTHYTGIQVGTWS
jgi:hypothetical protein